MKKIGFCEGWTYKRQGEETAKEINLPHDAMILEKRDPKSLSGSAGAFFPGGSYVYEKSFDIPADWEDKCVSFCFEGVYRKSRIFINDIEIGGCAYGYSQFYVSADGALKYGIQNTIRVTVDNSDQPNSRWYTGSGIYRPVWLLVSEKSHIDLDGVKISTLSYSPAKIRVEISHTGGDVNVEVLDGGKLIAKGAGDRVELDIPDAKLWSDISPNLYECRVSLSENGVETDSVTESFGIRVIEWSAKGLLVNGQNTLLRGGCVHHDNGILGARSYVKSGERRVRLLKEAGFNAIRSSHNPASAAMLEACDKIGVYVVDETWDMWYNHKTQHDYAGDFEANYKFDIQSLVARDYNHPSVIMYSIGNEVSEPATQKGQALTREMVELFHSLDNTRPVTGGFNLMIIHQAAKGKGIYKEEGGRNDEKSAGIFNGMNSTLFNMITQRVGTGMNNSANSKKADMNASPSLDALDIAGYNYGSGRYKKEGALHPNRLIFGAETFPQDIVENWKMVRELPYLIGDFMWTAWDYLGENGLGAWAYSKDGSAFDKPYPWLLADCGALDLLGNPNGEVYLAQAAWGLLDKPIIAVQPVNHPGIKPAKMVWRGTNAIPSWAWRNCDGNKAVVEIYAGEGTDRIELLLNGKSLGKKRVKNCVARFKIKYIPGKLEAISYTADGKELGRDVLQSATGQLSIRVTPEENSITKGDIAYVKVEIVGENGVVDSNADTKLSVSVEGGDLLAFGSANPRTPESYNDGSFTTYYGRAQAIVRADNVGKIKISVSGDGLETGTAEIDIRETAQMEAQI